MNSIYYLFLKIVSSKVVLRTLKEKETFKFLIISQIKLKRLLKHNIFPNLNIINF